MTHLQPAASPRTLELPAQALAFPAKVAAFFVVAQLGVEAQGLLMHVAEVLLRMRHAVEYAGVRLV